MSINLGAQKEELKKKVSGNLSKTLVPGSGEYTITGMSCKKNDYNNQDGFDIILNLEGPDLTEQGFEGFWIDQEDQSLGRHKGAVGKVKLSQYTFTTKTFPANGDKPAQTIDRDTSIVGEIAKLAKICNKFDEMFEGEVADIPSLIAKASEVFKGCKIAATIGGKEYLDKKNYTQYELFLVKPNKGFYNMEAPGASPSKLQVFDQSKHLIAKKGGTAAGAAIATPVAEDEFEPVDVEFAV